MASRTAGKAETLTERLSRLTQEHQDLVTTQTDAILKDIAAGDAALIAHAKADNTDGIAEVNDQITALHAKRSALTTAANHKQLAITETERLIVEERRAAAVGKFQPLVAAADPLAATVAEAMYRLIDALKALNANRAAAYTALTGYRDDQAAFGGIASMHSTFGDIDHHLRCALSLPVAAGPSRGDAVMQQATAKHFAASIR